MCLGYQSFKSRSVQSQYQAHGGLNFPRPSHQSRPREGEEEEENNATQRREGENGDGEEEGPSARVPAPPPAASPRAPLPLLGGRRRSRPPRLAAFRAPVGVPEPRSSFPMGSVRRLDFAAPLLFCRCRIWRSEVPVPGRLGPWIGCLWRCDFLMVV
jgi:hypothetical protein